jgi:hypothetical protein
LQLIDAAFDVFHRALARRPGIRLCVGLRGRAVRCLARRQAHTILRGRSTGDTGVARAGDGAGGGVLALHHRRIRTGGRAKTGAILGEGFGVFIENAARFGRVNRAHRCRIRNFQLLSRAHQIHIALDERLGIGAPQRHQHLVDRGVGHRVALCDGEQVVARFDVDRARRAPCTRGADGGGRHVSAGSAQWHQNADLHLALPRTRADIQQQIHRAACRRLSATDAQILARGVHAVFDPDNHAAQRHRRLQASALPGRIIRHRYFQRRDFIRRQLLQAHNRLQRRTRHGHDTRMPHAHGQRRTAHARPDRQGDRPLKGFQTAGMLHVARTLGHKLEFRSCSRITG